MILFPISALKSLAIAIAMSVFFALILKIIYFVLLCTYFIPVALVYTPSFVIARPSFLASMQFQQASCLRVHKKMIIKNAGWKPGDMVSSRDTTTNLIIKLLVGVDSFFEFFCTIIGKINLSYQHFFLFSRYSNTEFKEADMFINSFI